MVAYFHQIGGYRREIRLFLTYTLLINIGLGVFTLIYNLYLVQLSFREDYIGTFNGAVTFSLAGVAVVTGPLIGRFGNYACITVGTIFYVGTSVALSVLTNPNAILFFGVLNGAATALIFVPIMPFVVEWARPEARSTVAALTFSLTSLSTTAGSLIGGWSPRLFATLMHTAVESVPAYRLTLLAGIALSALGLIPLWMMTDARRHRVGDTAQAPLIGPIASNKQQIRKDMTVFILAGLALSFGAGAVVPFFNVYLESIGATPSQIGMIFSLAGIVAAAFGLLAPTTGRKLGPLFAELVLRILPAPAFLLLAIVPGLGVAVIAQVLRSISVSMAWPINSTFISDVLPPRARANAFSLRSGIWNFGYALTSLVAGHMIVTAGYGSTFVVFAISSIAGAFVFAGYFWRRYHVILGHRPAREPVATGSSRRAPPR